MQDLGNFTQNCLFHFSAIYGDWNGEWVDERSVKIESFKKKKSWEFNIFVSIMGSSSLRATDKKSQARIVAEEQWLQFGQEMGIPAHIFRLGGIYGPGRR